MLPDTFEAYFEKIATELKDIAHVPGARLERFKRMDIEEVLTALRGNIDLDSFCLLLESLNGNLEDNGADTDFNNQVSAFLVLRNCPEGDFLMQRETLKMALQIGFKVVSRLKKDAREGLGLENFKSTGLTYEKVGPLFDGAYGYRFELAFFDEVDLSFNPDDWNQTDG